MTAKSLVLSTLLGVLLSPLTSAQETVFSGPQVGEKLPPLKVKGLTGQWAGKSFDALEQIQDQPTLLIFFHSLYRPAFGMTRALAKYAESKKQAGMQTVVVFLTNDPTQTEKWAGILPQQMPAGPIFCFSPDGVEGPGAYGLNRNVILTILVAKDGVVTANAALAQPQLQADGPKILQAIVDVTGGGKVPDIAELEDQRMAMAPRMRAEKSTPKDDSKPKFEDAKFRELLLKVINKQADEAAVKQAAADVETYVEKNDAARAELARIATTIVNSDKLPNYGTAIAQDILRQWSKKYSAVKIEAPTAEPK